jgi:hypothetical protein
MADRISIGGVKYTITRAAALPTAHLRGLSAKDRERLREFAALVADYGATYYRRMLGHQLLERLEQLDRLAPAEPGDVRFDVSTTEDGETRVLVIDDRGEEIERHWFQTRSEAFDMVQAWREHQAVVERAEREGRHPLEYLDEMEHERERGF